MLLLDGLTLALGGQRLLQSVIGFAHTVAAVLLLILCIVHKRVNFLVILVTACCFVFHIHRHCEICLDHLQVFTLSWFVLQSMLCVSCKRMIRLVGWQNHHRFSLGLSASLVFPPYPVLSIF